VLISLLLSDSRADFSCAFWVDYKDFGHIVSAFQHDHYLRGILLRDVEGSVLEQFWRVIKSHTQLRKLVMNNITNCMPFRCDSVLSFLPSCLFTFLFILFSFLWNLFSY
jgi:hypothetical protein